MRILNALIGVFVLTLPAIAQAESGKIRLDGTTLIYDTDTPNADEEEGIAYDDVDLILDLLRANPEVSVMQLNSTGGKVWAASEISDIVQDFELDTHVHGDCESACATVFLAGTKRTMSRGSRLGFHQFSWASEDIKTYYEREREGSDWETPFEFAEWMYTDTQNEIFAHLTYMIEQGVDAAFAVETIKDNHDKTWRPKRRRLLSAGVLTE